MSENEIYVQGEPVPYGVYEMAQARNERREKRLWIALLVSITLIFASNIAWIIYESQYDTYSYQQDGAGVNNINTGEQGGIYNGTTPPSEEEAEGQG